MTTTIDTERALLAAIAAQPEEDTPRLVFADFLDEQAQANPVWVRCPTCNGTKQVENRNVTHYGSGWVYTQKCGCETGQILDTTNADWAALIREQIELSRLPNHPPNFSSRERELVAAHPEWLTMPCPDCGDSGVKSLVGYTPCQTCWGAKDLFIARTHTHYSHSDSVRPIHWHNGFIVVECQRDEVMREERLSFDTRARLSMEGLPTSRVGNWQPTPWARAVAANRMVMGLRLTDRVPNKRNDGKWWLSESVHYDVDATAVPQPLWPLMHQMYSANFFKKHGIWLFPTPDHATRALSYATMRWVRSVTSPA